MDGGIALSSDEIKGRNTWNLWCGGNEQFWDRVAREALGLFDLLKTIDSRHRGERFKELGLINQPGFKQATKPDKYGLWIDEAVEGEPAGIDPAVNGRPTGVMGFRLFDNPSFKGDAVKQWDPEKFNNDPQYATQKGLIRPYRVGVSCGSCHIAFHPPQPPLDVNNPKWENPHGVHEPGRQSFRAAPIYLFFLRQLEKSDPELCPTVDQAYSDELAFSEDHDVTNQFSAMGRLKPGVVRLRTIIGVLGTVNYAARHVVRTGRLGRIRTIDFARWVFLDGRKRMVFFKRRRQCGELHG